MKTALLDELVERTVNAFRAHVLLHGEADLKSYVRRACEQSYAKAVSDCGCSIGKDGNLILYDSPGQTTRGET